MPLNALRIPGIQDTPDDWADISHELDGVIRIDRSVGNIDPTGLHRDEWMGKMLSQEASVLEQGRHDILMAHSFGTHRAIGLTQRMTSIKAAVLMNPPRNDIAERAALRTAETRSTWSRREPETTMENLLWDVSLDMSDQTFADFAKRHEQANGSRADRKKLSALFDYLKNSTPFGQRLEAYEGDTPLLVLQSSDDPWRIENLRNSKSVRIVELQRKMHYPHVSDPQTTANIIRDWLQEIGVLTTQFQAPPYVDSEQQTTNATSLVL